MNYSKKLLFLALIAVPLPGLAEPEDSAVRALDVAQSASGESNLKSHNQVVADSDSEKEVQEATAQVIDKFLASIDQSTQENLDKGNAGNE